MRISTGPRVILGHIKFEEHCSAEPPLALPNHSLTFSSYWEITARANPHRHRTILILLKFFSYQGRSASLLQLVKASHSSPTYNKSNTIFRADTGRRPPALLSPRPSALSAMPHMTWYPRPQECWMLSSECHSGDCHRDDSVRTSRCSRFGLTKDEAT